MIVTLSGGWVLEGGWKQSVGAGEIVQEELLICTFLKTRQNNIFFYTIQRYVKRGGQYQIVIDIPFLVRPGAHVSISPLLVYSFLQPLQFFHGVKKLVTYNIFKKYYLSFGF